MKFTHMTILFTVRHYSGTFNLTFVENSPMLNFTILTSIGLCLVHFRLDLLDGDTIDTFQLCQYDPWTNTINVLASKEVNSKIQQYFLIQIRSLISLLKYSLTILDIGMNVTKIIHRDTHEFPFCMILFDSGDGMFFDISQHQLDIIEENFFDNLQQSEGKSYKLWV